MQEHIKTPHAVFFEKIFSVKAHTADFIKGVFPPEILKHLALSSLRHENVSYVTDELSRYFSDVVYTCKIKGADTKITLLLEHKSYPEKYIHLQLLKYMV